MNLWIKHRRKDGKYKVDLCFEQRRLTKILTPEELTHWVEKAENKSMYNNKV